MVWCPEASRVETFLGIRSLKPRMITVAMKGKVSVHLSDDRVILGAEIEGGHERLDGSCLGIVQ